VARPNRTFGFGYFDWEPSFARFEAAGRVELDRARDDTTVIDPRRRNDAWIHSTFLPWIRFTSFANAHRRDLSNPKLAFPNPLSVRWTLRVQFSAISLMSALRRVLRRDDPSPERDRRWVGQQTSQGRHDSHPYRTGHDIFHTDQLK